MDAEHVVEEGHVHDHHVEQGGAHRCGDQVRVNQWGDHQQGIVLAQGVERVEHLNHYQHRQGKSASLYLAVCEVLAWVLGQVHAFNEVVNLEVLPIGALRPVRQLIEADQGVAVTSLSHGVPVHKDTDSCETDIQTNDHVSEEDPAGDEVLVSLTWLLLHHVLVWGVEAEGRGWEAISHQVDPQKLHRVETFWNAQERGKEDRSHLANIGGNQVADKCLHVAVDAAALLNSLDNGCEVVISKHHVRDLLSNLSAGNTHSNADVGLLKSWGIINTITSHGNNFTHVDEDLDKLTLVSGLDSGEDFTASACESLLLLLQGETFKLCASEAGDLLVLAWFDNL